MSVLEKLRISEESDEDIRADFPDELPDDFDDNPDRDPQPGEAPARKPRAARPAAARDTVPRLTKKHKEEAAEEVETFLQMLALTWGWQAPPCGEALEAAAPDIAEKVVKLLARQPRWLLRVREGGILADALGIALAFKPVYQVAREHYFTPGGGDRSGGVTFNPDDFPAYRP